MADSVEIRLQSGREERRPVWLRGNELAEMNPFRLGGNHGEMQPALGSPRRVIAEKERIVSMTFSQLPRTNDRGAAISLGMGSHGLQREPDLS